MGISQDFVRKEISELSAYHVPSASGLIKLDAMENPYRLSPDLQRELGERLAAVAINRYPDPAGGGLHARLRAAFDIPTSARVVLGNGSDELITLITQTLARPGAVVLSPEPSFVMYRMNAVFSGMRYVGVSLRADFSLDLSAMAAAIEAHAPAVVFLAYPNNPTGPRFAREDVVRLLDLAPGLVVVDEAYAAYAEDSFMPLAGQHPKLVVMRTLSKLGLAGIRLGYMAGPAEWMDEFDKLRPPYNVNALTQAAAHFALDHLALFEAQAASLRAERDRMAAALARLPGLTVYPSEANFLTVRVPDAPRADTNLRAAGILIKRLHGTHPMLEHCLRLTIGTPEENDALLAALPACLGLEPTHV